ncbi:uncharacterized protein BDZ83DRAFT_640743 [Colletotrichum acutatum]|uniref:Uncharacterized protein n=1 Tax=Glomerella acutata TaxID=27357 RepID=A0AAD8XCF9_GLOAC|nr:uncharacterized protein BDZ83DRAFT_640743 [Colletotrichum acutatum]KAK1710054.1 hypothetical protein BDZ83DRAFT_640743 [Colletotrichum acutatum]
MPSQKQKRKKLFAHFVVPRRRLSVPGSPVRPQRHNGHQSAQFTRTALTLMLILPPHPHTSSSHLMTTAYSLILVNDLLSRQCTCHDAVVRNVSRLAIETQDNQKHQRTELQFGRRPPKNTAPMPNVLFSPCQAIILNLASLASSAMPRSRAKMLAKNALQVYVTLISVSPFQIQASICILAQVSQAFHFFYRLPMLEPMSSMGLARSRFSGCSLRLCIRLMDT